MNNMTKQQPSFSSQQNIDQSYEQSYEKSNEEIKEIPQAAKKLAWIFFATGLFAAIGALYRWGDGPLFNAPSGTDLQVYIADLLIAAPLSIVSAIGYYKLRKWAIISGILTAGTYIYGTILVYTSVIQNGAPYLLKLIIPPIFGIIFSIAIIWWTWKNFDKFCSI